MIRHHTVIAVRYGCHNTAVAAEYGSVTVIQRHNHLPVLIRKSHYFISVTHGNFVFRDKCLEFADVFIFLPSDDGRHIIVVQDIIAQIHNPD